MGIKGLGDFIKKKCPESIKVINIKELKNKNVCIDSNNFIYVNMYFANSTIVKKLDILNEIPDRKEIIRLWIEYCLNFAVMWMSNDITPIFVFDGGYPKEKVNTHNSRKERKEDIRKEMDDVKSGIIADPDNIFLINRLRSLMSQDITVYREEIDLMRNIFSNLGFPVHVAETEAEKHCADLCINGKCDFAFTKDTDILCYGVPKFINKFERSGKEINLTVIDYDIVLKTLGLEKKQFVDLCIMAGCDYNSNIKNIGIVKSYNLIKKHGNIESINVEGKEILDYETCRNIFCCENKLDNVVVKFDIEKLKMSRPLLRQYSLETLYEDLLLFAKVI